MVSRKWIFKFVVHIPYSVTKTAVSSTMDSMRTETSYRQSETNVILITNNCHLSLGSICNLGTVPFVLSLRCWGSCGCILRRRSIWQLVLHDQPMFEDQLIWYHLKYVIVFRTIKYTIAIKKMKDKRQQKAIYLASEFCGLRWIWFIFQIYR